MCVCDMYVYNMHVCDVLYIYITYMIHLLYVYVTHVSHIYIFIIDVYVIHM